MCVCVCVCVCVIYNCGSDSWLAVWAGTKRPRHGLDRRQCLQSACSPARTRTKACADRHVRFSALVEMMPSTYVNRDKRLWRHVGELCARRGKGSWYGDTQCPLCSSDSGLLMLGAVNNLPISSFGPNSTSSTNLTYLFILDLFTIFIKLLFFYIPNLKLPSQPDMRHYALWCYVLANSV